MIDSAADLQAEAAALAQQAAEYRSLAESTQLAGRVSNHMEPLPPRPHYRPREWEQETTR